MLKNLENKGNPWGMPSRARLEWTQGLDFEVPVLGQDVEDLAERRVPVLGRLRRCARRPGQEDHPGLRRAAAHRRREVRGARRGRGLLRRPGPAAGQRVRLPDARPAERRDAERGRRRQDGSSRPARTASTPSADEYPQLGGHYEVVHHTQLLARLVARGPPHPGHADRRAGDLPRPLLPRPAQQGLHAAARGARRRARPAHARRCTAARSAASAAAPAARGCGWRRGSASGSTTSGSTRRSRWTPTSSPPPARSASSCSATP